jgi:hypothetical protein
MANQSIEVMPFSCIAMAAPTAIQRAGLSDGMPSGSSGCIPVSLLTFSTYALVLFSLGINKLNGSESIVIASQQYTKPGGKGKADVFSSAMKQDYKSKNPTTRWSDIIKLK